MDISEVIEIRRKLETLINITYIAEENAFDSDWAKEHLERIKDMKFGEVLDGTYGGE